MRSAALSAVVYLLLTALFGVDVIMHVNTRIASDPGDPLFSAAVLTWNAEHIALTHDWWQFPIFHPTPDVLAFSEHMLGVTAIAAPLYWLTGQPVLSYNVSLLVTYPLCGLAMFALVYRLTRSGAVAFVAGLAYLLAPVRASQLSHIQMLATFYLPVVLLALHAFIDSGRRGWLTLAGAAWLLQCAVSAYLLLYGSVLIAAWILWFVVAPRRWPELRAIGVTLVLASLPLVPLMSHYWTVHVQHGFSRGVGEAALFSADITALLCAPSQLTFWGWLRVGCKTESDIFPGLALIVLCVAGAWWHYRSSRHPRPDTTARSPREIPAIRLARRVLIGASGIFILAAIVSAVAGDWRLDLGPIHATSSSPAKPSSIAFGLLLVAALLLPGLRSAAERSSTPLFYLFATLTTWLLAWGPEPEFRGTRILFEAPFAWLMRLPGGDGVRVPARFWLLSAMCLVVLMGLLVAEMLKRRNRTTVALVVAAASCGVIVDGWAWIPAGAVPATPPRPELMRGGVVLELPAGDTIGDIAAVYRAVMGGWRTVNGYSGYEPAEYQKLRDDSAAGTIALAPLASGGTLHVLVSEQAGDLNRLVATFPGSRLIGQDGGLVQYRIENEK